MFTRINKPLDKWSPRIRLLALATSVSVGFIVSESAWTDTCDHIYPTPHCVINTTISCFADTDCPATTTYTLTLNETGTGSGTVSGNGTYPAGTTVDLVETADTGSLFAGWSPLPECYSGMPLNSNMTCTATFNLYSGTGTPTPTPVTQPSPTLPKTVNLEIAFGSGNDSGHGTVTTNIGGIDCNNIGGTKTGTCVYTHKTANSSETVTLQHKAADDSTFRSWGGNDDCGDGEVTLSSSSLYCTAYFDLKPGQVITNFAPATPTLVGSNATLTATGGASGNPVIFASTTESICTVAGNTVSFIKDGTCTVTADQAGNDKYRAAPTVTATIQVNAPFVKKDQVITNFTPATSVSVNSNATLTATGGASGNPVIFASTTPTVCTVSDKTVNFVTEGTCTVTANQNGDDDYDYNAATTVTATIQVNAPFVKKDQVITNFSPTGYTIVVGEPTANGKATLTATGGASGNPVKFSSATPEICTVSGNTVSFLTAGTCKINADQSGNDQYNAAPQVTTKIQVNKPVEQPAQQTTHWSLVTTSTVGNSLTLTATGNSVTFTSATPAICTVSGNIAHFDAVGICTVTANQAGSATSEVVATITVEAVKPSTTTPTTDSTTSTVSETTSPVPACPGIKEENGVYIVSASCNADGQVFDKPVVIKPGVNLSNATFNNTVDNQGFLSNITIGKKGEVKGGTLSGFVDNQGNVCDVQFVGSSFVGGTVCGKIRNDSKVDACLKEVTASWTDTVITGCVEKETQKIIVSDITTTPGTTTTTTPGTTTTPDTTTPSDTSTSSSTSNITIPSTSVKKDQQITFYEALPTTAKVGDVHFLPAIATASSDLVVNLVNDTPKVCELLGTTVKILTVGTCTFTASQAGNDNYNAATPVSVNITVEKKSDQRIRFLTTDSVQIGDTESLIAFGGLSGNPVTFASTTPMICSVSVTRLRTTLRFDGVGTCTVEANQAGNDQYNAANPVSANITVQSPGDRASTTVFYTFNRSFIGSHYNRPMMGPLGQVILGHMGFGFPHSRYRSKPTPMTGNNLAFLSALGDSLQAAGYPRNDLVVGTDGNLFVAGDDHGLLARVNETEAYTGTQTPGLYSPETGFPYLVFMDTDGQLKQTVFYPLLSPTISTAMTRDFPTVTLDTALDGTIKLILEGGIFSFWQAGYVVTAGNEASDMEVVNDNLVLSGGGQSQELTPAAPVFDDSSIAFLKVLQPGISELGLDPNHLMMTGLGTFVITDANDQTIVSFQAVMPELDTGTQAAGLYVPEGKTPYVLFMDVDNQLKRSLLHPALSPDILVAALEAFPQSEFTLSPDGKITVSFDGEPATEWQPAYRVTTGGETFEKQLVEGQLIWSGGGQSQILLPVQP